LQDKVRFCRALNRHQESVVDIAVAILPEVQDPARRCELLGHGQKLIQGFISFRKVPGSKFNVQS
jgi:hypothetical protein